MTTQGKGARYRATDVHAHIRLQQAVDPKPVDIVRRVLLLGMCRKENQIQQQVGPAGGDGKVETKAISVGINEHLGELIRDS